MKLRSIVMALKRGLSALSHRLILILSTALFLHAAVPACEAAEIQSLVVTVDTDVVNDTDNKTSLREALAYATQLAGSQTVTFSNSTAGGATNFHDGTARTITLVSGQLTISTSVTITGPGANLLEVNGDDNSRIFLIDTTASNVVVKGLTLSLGSAEFGGCIENQAAGNVTISACTFLDNAADYGGGINHNTAGLITVSNCTFSSNYALWFGGGIHNALGGTVKVFNSTFWNNKDGALVNATTGTLEITNCTISGNSAYYGGGVANYSDTAVKVANSIIAGNTAKDSEPDIIGNFNSLGSNLIGDPGNPEITSGFTNGVNGDKVGVADAKLGSLQYNGGSTQTMALLSGSPAVDAGNNARIPIDPETSLAFTTDQRGYSRIATVTSAVVDIGAYEAQLIPITFADGVAANGIEVEVADNLLDLRSAVVGASPSGGTFSGPGVASNVFDFESFALGTYTITYTGGVSDAAGASSSQTFNITIKATRPYMRVIAVPGSGVPGEPVVTAITNFGIPSIDNGQVAARVSIVTQGSSSVLPAIFVGTTLNREIVAKKGDSAPAVVGTVGTFASFGEPAFGDGAVAFNAKLAGAPKTASTGLWSNIGGTLHLVAASTVTAPDTAGASVTGLNFDKITSYALSADGVLTFVATLKGTGVTGANKTGIFQETEAGTNLIFRTGNTCDLANSTFGTGPDVVQKLTLFTPAKTIPGQRRSYAGENRVVEAVATFSKNRQALLRYSVDINDVASRTIALQNTSIAKLALPSGNAAGEFAMRAGLRIGGAAVSAPSPVTAKDDLAILTGTDQASLSIIAREGSAVSSNVPHVFTTFEEPALNDASATAFFAKVKATGLPASQTGVLVYNRFVPANTAFENLVLARTGTLAADLNGGELWKSFTAMALSDSGNGPVFLAKLSGPGVKASNATGLWATDSDENVHLVVRTGSVVSIYGEDKTVSLITTLGAAKDSPGQGRYVDGNGNIAALLTFTDRSNALVYFGMPTDP